MDIKKIDWQAREALKVIEESNAGLWEDLPRFSVALVEVTVSTKPGFAMMDPSKQREIARKGGKAASLSEFGNRFREGEAAAKAAGHKGGVACARKKVGAHAPKEKSP